LRRGGQEENTHTHRHTHEKNIMNMCGEKTKIKANKKPVLTQTQTHTYIQVH